MWLIIILIIIIILLLSYIIRYKNDIKYISTQITESKGGFSNIRMNTLEKNIEKLVVCINNLYEINQKSNLNIKQEEEILRSSIENLSHDLRTPLTSIIGYIQLIKDDNLSKEEKAKYIEIIERRTRTLQALITSFYDLSRIEGNEYSFDFKVINLKDILCETIALYYEDFLNKDIEPDIRIEENTPSMIGDGKAITRIFSNLINNVLEHGENKVSIVLKNEKNSIVTEFINELPNLNEENVNNIFDRFFTADLARSDKSTGLGLSITKALVEQLGHKVESLLIDGVLIIKITWKI